MYPVDGILLGPRALGPGSRATHEAPAGLHPSGFDTLPSVAPWLRLMIAIVKQVVPRKDGLVPT